MSTELCKRGSFDEDGYSAVAREDDTSVRGVISPSDWGGSTWSVQNAGGGADDSTVVARPNTPSEITNNKDHHPSKKKRSNKNGDTKSNKSHSWKLFQWWSDFISRASRSATSLLNQHSPNLNDILDGNEENPLATVEQRPTVEPSIPEDNDEVFALLEEVAMLKKRIEDMENEANSARNSALLLLDSAEDIPSISPIQMLQSDQISRYSRQLLLKDGFGVSGQKQLMSSSILVVGAGGIGSTALLYLAAAGVGHITVVDYDRVEMTNLHRQIIHKDSNASKGVNGSNLLGMNKALSAKQAMLDLNPSISCTALDIMITGENALELVSKHDVVVDACDNPRTRYLLNDACILGAKPLVSGSAMGTEGQLTVYNYHSESSQQNETKKKQTACYRCLYPNQVVSEGCKSCSDNGVLGPVPGIIGTLQAVEAIKVVTGIGNVMHDRLMMYDSLHCSFLNVRKPPAKHNCSVCSSNATIKNMKDSAESLEKVRGPSVCALPISDGLSPEHHISCKDYNAVRAEGKPHVLLDVRVTRQYEMCSLEGSVNLPLEELTSKLDQVEKLSGGELPIYCLCRRGVASAEAVKILQNAKDDKNAKGIHSVYNISGGLNSWVANVDSSFPSY